MFLVKNNFSPTFVPSVQLYNTTLFLSTKKMVGFLGCNFTVGNIFFFIIVTAQKKEVFDKRKTYFEAVQIN